MMPFSLRINTLVCLKINQYSTGLFVSHSCEKPNCTKTLIPEVFGVQMCKASQPSQTYLPCHTEVNVIKLFFSVLQTLSPHSQNFIFLVTYNWVQSAGVSHYTKQERQIWTNTLAY